MQDYRGAPLMPEERHRFERSQVSEAGRPQFLPPEEPAVDPPPPDPPPASPRRWPVAAVVVAAVAVGGGALLLQDEDRRAVPVSHAAPEFAALPDACLTLHAALPPAVRSVRPVGSGDSCSWKLLRADRARTFEVMFKLETGQTGTASGTAKAGMELADDLAYADDPARNGGFERNPERLTGLGDEAFAAGAFNVITSGREDYHMGGAEVEARLRNVIVTVKWRGADYPPSARGKKRLVGRQLPYPVARDQAITVIRTALAKLR
jgi:hypothetical protein